MDRPSPQTPHRRLLHYQDWGCVEYKKAEVRQKHYFEAIIAQKKANKGTLHAASTKDHLFFCSHPSVFTIGRNGDASHLLVQGAQLRGLGIDFVRCGRGGDITYHGAGQVVVYPVLDLEHFFRDIGRYMRSLEESVIRTLKDYGLASQRISGRTGVWIAGDPPRKIAALGVRSSHWVTMHGLAFNVNVDLSPYRYIVPCGLSNASVTSMQKELGRLIDEAELKGRLRGHLGEVLDCDMRPL